MGIDLPYVTAEAIIQIRGIFKDNYGLITVLIAE